MIGVFGRDVRRVCRVIRTETCREHGAMKSAVPSWTAARTVSTAGYFEKAKRVSSCVVKRVLLAAYLLWTLFKKVFVVFSLLISFVCTSDRYPLLG